MSGQHCKSYDVKRETVHCHPRNVDRCFTIRGGPDVVVAGISAPFSKFAFALFCYMCLNQVYESSASTFAINDQLKGSK